ncbi:MAG: hypothetical protein EAX96_07780 [Candidatus Lokiarchaeota archaeon]|nr:hypothetical protein [Candidatus Lokiarchaeota archaeon]
MIYKIPDDSGFIGIVNVDKYITYLKKDWWFEDLERHFLTQMHNLNLLLWATGLEEIWRVDVHRGISKREGFRSVLGNIQVTNRKLYFISYDDLSYVAQFEDERLPNKGFENNFINLENGLYRMHVIQVFPLDGPYDPKEPQFIIEYEPTRSADNIWTKIPWFTEKEYG